MNDFQLTPPPNGTDAPNGRLQWMHDLEGKTVRKVIECPCGIKGHLADAVIVCDDNTWLPIVAEPDGSENATIMVVSPHNHYRQGGITDILHPREVLEAELVNHEQYLLLERQYEAQKQAEKNDRAARLRAEAERLEAGR